MTEFEHLNLVLPPIGLGLLGFVEPCSIGSSFIFIKYLEGKGRLAKLSQVTVFTLTRGVLIGHLGASAAWLGTAPWLIEVSMGHPGGYLCRGRRILCPG